MSIKILSRVWEKSKAKGSGLLVLLAIADNSNDENIAWPSIKTISKKARMSERNVQYAIQKLVELGELEVSDQASRYGTNEYRILAGVQSLHRGGASPFTGGVQAVAPGGVQTVAPEPSLLTVNEPSTSDAKKPRHAREIDPAQKELTQYFSELTHLKIPEPKSKRDWGDAQQAWFKPIAHILELANGRGRELVKQTVEKMRFDKLNISSPRSIVKVADALYGENHRHYAPRTSQPEFDPNEAYYEYIKEQQNAARKVSDTPTST